MSPTYSDGLVANVEMIETTSVEHGIGVPWVMSRPCFQGSACYVPVPKESESGKTARWKAARWYRYCQVYVVQTAGELEASGVSPCW
jgi:hypothetical protein